MKNMKILLHEDYAKGLNLELGYSQVKDYKKAEYHYRKAALDGSDLAKRKLRYLSIQPLLIYMIVISFVIIIINLMNNTLWIGFFISGLLLFFGTVFHYKLIWHKRNYVYYVYSFFYYISLTVLFPLSSLTSYLRGITFLPLMLLFVVSFMVTGSGIVFMISERDSFSIKLFSTGLLILILTVASFYISTPDKMFEVAEIEGGLMITQYRSSDKHVVIPKRINNMNVISIGPYAFNNTEIESVYVGNHIKSIGSLAFANNDKLVKVHIEDDVMIGQGLFYNNIELSEVDLPSTLTTIPSYTFYNNVKIENFTFNDKITSIGDYAFYNVFNLDYENLPKSLNYLGNYAFTNNLVTKAVILPNTLMYIGEGALSNQKSLESVTLSNSLTTLSRRSLSYNNNLKSIEIPESIIKIEAFALSDNPNLNQIILHDEIIEIGEGAFSNNPSLEEIILPNQLKVISKLLLANNVKINHIEVPNQVTEIQNEAFKGTSNLESIILPDGLITIGSGVFENAVAIKNVDLPNTLKSMGGRVFYNASSLESIIIPNEVKYIGEFSFYGALSLESVEFSDELIGIGKHAFSYTKLSVIKIPQTMTIIEEYTFFQVKTLKSIDLPKTLIEIKNYAFYGAENVELYDLPESLISIGDLAFGNNKALEVMIIPSNVEYIGYYLFFGIENLIINLKFDSIPQEWNLGWNKDNLEVIYLN